MKNQLQQILKYIIFQKWKIEMDPKIEIPEDLVHGDYTTNVAMILVKQLKTNPIKIANEIKDELLVHSSKFEVGRPNHSTDESGQKVSVEQIKNIVLQDIDKIEVVAPGFINFFVSASKLSIQLEQVLKIKEAYGKAQNQLFHSKLDQLVKPASPAGRLDKLGDALDEVNSNQTGESSKVMVEFAHPNTHKAFHIGHLRNITTGESIVRLLESQGAKVIRANYQGDVGMHIAKALYGILHNPEIKKQVETYSSSDETSTVILERSASWRRSDRISNNEILSSMPSAELQNDNVKEKVELLGKAYTAGSKAHETDKQAKKEIGEINKQIYAVLSSHAELLLAQASVSASSSNEIPKRVRDDRNDILELYQTTRQWSLDYFSDIYKRVYTHYDRYYFESEVFESGKKNVLEGLKKGIFTRSEGAVIFPGEKFGLHNRVFVTGEGNPTYEGKDMGLAPLQFNKYHPDLIIHIVGPEQAEYFKVVFEALYQLNPQMKNKQFHLIYGWVKLKKGKMSSRLGNVVLGEWLIDEAKQKIYNILQKNESKDDVKASNNNVILSNSEGSSYDLDKDSHLPAGEVGLHGNDKGFGYSENEKEQIAETAAIAAVKYSFLKVSTQQEIAFDIEESVNFEGDSGPYLLYTYARAKSVLRKSNLSFRGVRPEKSSPDDIRDVNILRSAGSLASLEMTFNPEELTILRLIHQFPEIVAKTAQNYAPNILCKYLFTLAQAFNLFYNKHSILGNTQNEFKNPCLAGRQENSKIKNQESRFRLSLTQATSQVLKNGLYLLGIKVLERM